MAQHFPRSPAGFRGTIDQPPTTLGKRTCKKCNTGHSGKKKSKPKLHVTMLSWYPLHIHLNYKMVGYQLDKKNHVRTKKWCFVSTISIIQTKNGWKTAIAKWISINLKLQKKTAIQLLNQKMVEIPLVSRWWYQAWLWEETSQVPPTVTGHRRWHPALHFQRPDGTSLAWREPQRTCEKHEIYMDLWKFVWSVQFFFPCFDSFQTFLPCLSYFSDMVFPFRVFSFTGRLEKNPYEPIPKGKSSANADLFRGQDPSQIMHSP